MKYIWLSVIFSVKTQNTKCRKIAEVSQENIRSLSFENGLWNGAQFKGLASTQILECIVYVGTSYLYQTYNDYDGIGGR